MFFYDTLTGLPDAVLLVDRLQQSLAHASRRKQEVALLYLDIDRFRQITDAYGDSAGDGILREMARRLKHCALRKEDTVARLCGDQFVMVLGDIDGDHGTKNVLEKVMAVTKQRFNVAGRELEIRASIGASLFPHDGSEWSPLLRFASMLMRQAKLAGGNCYVYSGDGIKADDDWAEAGQTPPRDRSGHGKNSPVNTFVAAS